MTSLFSVPFTDQEQRFADFAQQHGWTFGKELVPAGEHQGESWDEFIALSLSATRPLPDGSVYAHVLSVSGMVVSNDWYWPAYLEFATAKFEREYGAQAS